MNIKQVGGQVYAILFSDGLVKVGRGYDARSRVITHEGAAKARGVKVVEKYFSGPLIDPKSCEKKVIEYCKKNGDLAHGLEWFSKINYEALKEYIKANLPRANEQEIFKKREEIKNKAEEVGKYIFDSINEKFNIPTEITMVSQEEKEWSNSLVHASTIQKVMQDDLFYCDSFKLEAYGVSKFELSCAIVVSSMCAGEIAGLYNLALHYPEDCINLINEKCSCEVTEFIKSGLWRAAQ